MDLQQILIGGEDSRTQFKCNSSNPDQLAQELVAFSNTLGKLLVIGVADKEKRYADTAYIE